MSHRRLMSKAIAVSGVLVTMAFALPASQAVVTPGDASSTAAASPVAAAAPSPGLTLSAGSDHGCVIVDADLSCWGGDLNERLGDGPGGSTWPVPGQQTPKPVDMSEMPEGTEWASVSAGGTSTCAVTTDGDGYCWGGDVYGGLGNGPDVEGEQSRPSAIDVSGLPAGTTWASISVGGVMTCGVTTGGDGYCWGNDGDGSLGNGSSLTGNQASPTPVDVSGLPDGVSWQSISSGARRAACGLTGDGDIYCWGADDRGQLGNGPDLTGSQDAPTPLDTSALPAGTTWASVQVGWEHACGLTVAGEAYCWGADEYGALGNGPALTADQPSPSGVATSGLPAGTSWAEIITGSEHSCGIDQDATAYCWGDDRFYQLGNGPDLTETQVSPSPVDVSELPQGTAWATLTARGPSCGVTVDDVAYCWGTDFAGDLGNGPDLTGPQARPTPLVFDYEPPAPTSIAITEWMYRGLGDTSREYIEVTNVGDDAIDMTGWSYDDDSRDPGGFDLSGFGIVQPGESAVLTEMDPVAFRSAWQLCSDVKVLGPFTNNIGRNDEINIYNADDLLVDRLTYGDEAFPGSIRTDARGGWVSEAGLGQNNVLEWTLSSVGDVESSYESTLGDTGSPGWSRHGGFDPCDGGGDGESPTVETDQAIVAGAIGDPANPGAVLTVDDPDHDVAELTIDVSVSDESVIEVSGIDVTGDGAERTASFDPAGRGVTTVTFTVTDPDGNEDSVNVSYAASNQAPDPTGRYHHRISDASAALDVGDGYMLVVNDETNTIFLHRQAVSGPPVKTWTFTSEQLGTGDEIDFESLARSGDLLVMGGSHGNNRSGEVRTERRTFVGATISGSGADTELAFRGRYNDLWSQLRSWDESDGHGLGADALGFVSGTASGVQPNPPDGFNIEAAEFAPDGAAVYLGFRAPTIDVDGAPHGLIVPLVNADDLVDGAPGTGPAEFGDPILLDLDGRSIRAMRKNAEDEYLISAGPSPANGTWALYTWDGDPSSEPVFNRELPSPDLLTGGSWESIVSVPHPLGEGAGVRLVADSGDTNFYGTGQTKDLAPPYQKSYSQEFVLAGAGGPGEGDQSISVTVPELGSGEFVWSIDGDGAVDLGEATDEGAYLQATGALDPIVVTDTRAGGPVWSISGQVSDFSGGLSGSYLGWSPQVLSAGAGAVAGDPVASGIDGGDGLSVASVLASAGDGHESGSGTVGAELDLRLPVETDPGDYTATLTITALS